MNADNIGLQNLCLIAYGTGIADCSLQQLNWLDDLKADAHKAAQGIEHAGHVAAQGIEHAGHVIAHDAGIAAHDLIVAGQKCGQNKMCTDITRAAALPK